MDTSSFGTWRRISILMMVALGASLALVACDSGDQAEATPTASLPETATSAPVPGWTPTPTETPFASPTSVSDITQISIPKGGVVADGWGLVIGNKLTGGAEVWLMPGGTRASGISPSGRYFVWGDSIFDGWTGARTKVIKEGNSITFASFAPDDHAVYVHVEGNGRVMDLDGRLIAELPAFAPTKNPTASNFSVVWSSDSRGVAITRYADTSQQVDVVIDGRLQAPLQSTGMASWSNAGLRLAVTGENPAIYDFERNSSRDLARGGQYQYPAWSENDQYVAVDISDADRRGVAVFDVATGAELFRVYNAFACFNLYWSGEDLLLGYSGLAARAPSGELVEPSQTAPTDPFELPQLRFEENRAIWSDAAGEYATVTIIAGWAASFSWVRRDVADFPPVIGLGLGGKDACIGQSPPPVVVFPPFTADKIPTPIPTPDK